MTSNSKHQLNLQTYTEHVSLVCGRVGFNKRVPSSGRVRPGIRKASLLKEKVDFFSSS